MISLKSVMVWGLDIKTHASSEGIIQVQCPLNTLESLADERDRLGYEAWQNLKEDNPAIWYLSNISKTVFADRFSKRAMLLLDEEDSRITQVGMGMRFIEMDDMLLPYPTFALIRHVNDGQKIHLGVISSSMQNMWSTLRNEDNFYGRARDAYQIPIKRDWRSKVLDGLKRTGGSSDLISSDATILNTAVLTENIKRYKHPKHKKQQTRQAHVRWTSHLLLAQKDGLEPVLSVMDLGKAVQQNIRILLTNWY